MPTEKRPQKCLTQYFPDPKHSKTFGLKTDPDAS